MKNISGVGNSIFNTIKEFVEIGNSTVQKEYLKNTPDSVIELLYHIRGLGVKKINILWKQYQIESIDALYNKCKNNEVADLKGFGVKFQEKMIARIEFYFQHKGFKLYAKIIHRADELLHQLQQKFSSYKSYLCGELARQLPVIKQIEIVTTVKKEDLLPFLQQLEFTISKNEEEDFFTYHKYYREVVFYFSDEKNIGTTLFKYNGTEIFKAAFNTIIDVADEQKIFEVNKLPFLPPYLREDTTFLYEKINPKIIQKEDIKGIIHCHSKWSDGENSIEDIALYCIEKKFEYLVLTDHSKSSVIANGLNIARIKEQHLEIEKINKKLFPFKIFKSVECDILNDGSLDYEEDILQTFDIVIASIHNNLDMDKEVATQRVINAVKNPYTHILGHSSGRLLLNRKGYLLDYEQVFEACKKYYTAIELNANPFRLDIDWQYLQMMKHLGIKTSINPDAHSLEGVNDIQYGIAVAQKGALLAEDNISSLNLKDFELYLQEWKKKKQY